MTLAEDLLLLMTDDDSGKLTVEQTAADTGLAGAMLTELLDRGLVTLDAAGNLRPAPGGGVDEPLLDRALRDVGAAEDATPAAALRSFSDDLRLDCYHRLVQRGLLREQSKRVLGIVPRTSWPATEVAHEESLRRSIAAGLEPGARVDLHVRALVVLLHAIGALDVVAGGDRRQVEQRAAELAAADPVARAVQATVREEIDSAVAANTVITVAAT